MSGDQGYPQKIIRKSRTGGIAVLECHAYVWAGGNCLFFIIRTVSYVQAGVYHPAARSRAYARRKTRFFLGQQQPDIRISECIFQGISIMFETMFSWYEAFKLIAFSSTCSL